jgi:antitoxin component YwqK of YwqJK toxin-antitoxin module
MTKKLIIFISILIYGCNDANINNKDKRNENWIYWIDEKTGEKSWVPVGNETTIKNGKYTSFYNKGTIYKKGKLKNGKEIDTIYFYDLNEKIIQYLIVKPDTLIHYYLKNGPYISHSQNGKIFEKGIIENHNIGNEWTKYFDNGKIDWTKKLVNGTGWNYWYYKNGQISDQNYHLNGNTNGEVKTWYENGQVKEISNWSNGIQNGLFELFYENGKPKERTNWLNGKSEGKSESWYENGLKKNIKFFKNNLLDGNIQQWHSNGKMELNANYSSGQRNGKAIVYYENGKLKAETVFKNDIKNGIFILYDENGNVVKKENYINGQLVE